MLTVEVQQLTGARTFVGQPETIGQRSLGLPVQFVIQAPSFEKLTEALPRFLEETQQEPTFLFTDVNLKFNKPELQISIDRERARSMGVSALDIAQTLQLALSEQRLGYFIIDGKQYQVIGQVERQNRNEPLDLQSIFVRNANGEPIQLDNLVQISEESSPPQLFRFNRFVSATVSAGLAPGKTIGDGIEAMERIADRTLDESFSTDLAGPSRDFAESSSSLLFVFLLAPAADLPGAGCSVREFPGSLYNHAHCSAGAWRGPFLVVVLQSNTEHLQSDWYDHAHRIGY